MRERVQSLRSPRLRVPLHPVCPHPIKPRPVPSSPPPWRAFQRLHQAACSLSHIILTSPRQRDRHTSFRQCRTGARVPEPFLRQTTPLNCVLRRCVAWRPHSYRNCRCPPWKCLCNHAYTQVMHTHHAPAPAGLSTCQPDAALTRTPRHHSRSPRRSPQPAQTAVAASLQTGAATAPGTA